MANLFPSLAGARGGEVVEHFGVRIPLKPELLSPMLMQHIREGKYEQHEARQIPRIITKNERILELGAGLGFISTLAARNPLTQAVRVYEANPKLIPYIREVHALNGVANVEIENAVLTNSPGDGSTKFYVRADFWAPSLSPEPFAYVEAVDVPTRSLSGEIETFRPTLIICDIEGGELALFQNANLEGVKKIYMEIHQKVLGRRGVKRLFDAMSARDFHYDQYHSNGGVVLFSHVDRDRPSK